MKASLLLVAAIVPLFPLPPDLKAAAKGIEITTDRYTAGIDSGTLNRLKDRQGRDLVVPGDSGSGAGLTWNRKDFTAGKSALAGKGTMEMTDFPGLEGARSLLHAESDADGGDLVVTQEAETDKPGLKGAEWAIAFIPLDYNILIPGGNGEIMTRNSPYKQRSFNYLLGWDAQLLVIEGKGHGFYLWCDDTDARPKSVSIARTDAGWRIVCRTVNLAPWDNLRKLEWACHWRVNVYEGDWRVPARRYRTWAEQAFHPVPLKDQNPAWVKDIHGFVYLFRQNIPILEELARQFDPKQTLIFLSHWRQPDFDRDFPNYDHPREDLAPFMKRAHELGFRVMLYTNFWAISPGNIFEKEMLPYQVRDENGKPMFYRNLLHTPPVINAYINPASKKWREMFVAMCKRMIDITGADAIHLDQDFHSHNDYNGLIDGMTLNQGVLALHRELREALPQIPLGGEGLNELTYRYLAFAQRHVWSAMEGTIDRAALGVGHPIASYLEAPYVRLYGWLGLPNPEEKPQSYAAWREDYKDWGVYCSPRYEKDMSPITLQHPHGFHRQEIEEVKYFEKNGVEPDIDGSWSEDVAFPFRAKDGTPVLWMKDRRIVAGNTEISRTLVDVKEAVLPGTIDGWLFYDAQRLFGLDPSQFYAYFTTPRDMDRIHIPAVPEGLDPGHARLTSDFLLTELRRQDIPVFDCVKSLPKTACGLRLFDGGTYSETGGVSGRNSATLAGAASTLALTPPSRSALAADRESTVGNHSEALGEVYASFQVTVPAQGETWFRSAVGMDGRAIRSRQSDGMTFIVRAEADGKRIENQASTKEAARVPLDLDLRGFAGKTVQLELIGQAGPAKDATEDRGIWYEPRVVQTAPHPLGNLVVPLRKRRHRYLGWQHFGHLE